jgi:hypothetical protein
LSNTSAVDLFLNTELVGVIGWLSTNNNKVQNVSVKTINGGILTGNVVQVTPEYIALSYNDQFAEGDFSGTIIPIRAIASIDFRLPAANNSSGSTQYSRPPRGDAA